MALESIQVSAVIPATPFDVYDAWLDGGRHGAMTGGRATVEPTVGGRHTAWDGYIEGTTLELDPGRRIVQSWRSLDFPVEAVDSRLEIVLRSVEGGTELTLHHSEIPEGQGGEYEQGWIEHYFRPMERYFSGETLPEPRQAVVNGANALQMTPLEARFEMGQTPVERPAARVVVRTQAKSKAKRPAATQKKKRATRQKAAAKTPAKKSARKTKTRTPKSKSKSKAKSKSKSKRKTRR